MKLELTPQEAQFLRQLLNTAQVSGVKTCAAVVELDVRLAQLLRAAASQEKAPADEG